CSEKKLSKINEDFISEGPAYNCCTEFLESSGIMFDNKHWKIVMAMAPIFMKVMAEEKKRFDKTDYVLLFLEPKELIPVAGQNKRKKFLLNVFGDVYPCVDDNPCGCCLFYSTSKDTCSNCEIIEKEEKEQELEEWRNVNRDFFNQHKHRIPKRFHNSFLQERDP